MNKKFLVFCIMSIGFLAPMFAQDLKQDDAKSQVQKSLVSEKGSISTFGTHSLTGTWAFSGSGFTSDSPSLPVTTIGTYTFDGEGGCSCTRMENGPFGYLPPTAAEECNYTVNSDGTGAIAIIIEETEVTYGFVITKTGELYWMRQDDVLTSGTAQKRIGPAQLFKQ